MSPRNLKLTPGIDGRLAAYAALAGATLAVPSVAKATIVYSGVINLPVPNNIDGVYINFVTGQTGTSGMNVPGFNWNPYNSGSGLTFFWDGAPNGGLSLDGTTYAVLGAGVSVSGANTFTNTNSPAALPGWRAGSTGMYLGIRFVNSVTSATNYGWVRLDTTGPTGFPPPLSRMPLAMQANRL